MKPVSQHAMAGLALLALCAGAHGAPAREAGAHQKVSFEITAPDMVQALIQFTKQSGLQLAFPMDGSTDMPAPKVSGEFTPTAALEQLLAGSGLQYEFANDRTVSISTSAASQNGPTKDISSGASSLRLAQASSSPGSASTRSVTTNDGAAIETKPIPEVLVKGSRTLNMDIQRTEDDAQPYVVFDRKVIQDSGTLNLEEFLRSRLTSASAPISSLQSIGSGSNASVIDLRGLGSAQTLILVDGHRIAPRNGGGSAAQPDINGIPLSAIERIEVLPATASGIYGGSATGGVVNIVLRRDYNGLETTLTYDNSFEGGGLNRRVDVASGLALEGGKTNVMFAGTYSDGKGMRWSDRDYLERARARILENNPASLLTATTPPLGSTTNIRSTSGAPLSLKAQYGGTPLNSAVTSVPLGYQGVTSDNGAGLVANAGAYNLAPAPTAQLTGDRQSLLGESTIKSASVTLRRDFTSWLNAFLDLSSTENSGLSYSSIVSGRFTLLANSPANPFAQAITVTTPAFGTDQVAENTEQSYRAVAGFIFDLPGEWRAEADHTWNRSRTETEFGSAIVPIAAAGPATQAVRTGVTASGSAFNVFRDTNSFPVDFAPYLTASDTRTPIRATFNDTAIRVAGPLGFSLPAGAPQLSMLLEHRKESLGDATIVGAGFTLTNYSRSQSIDSIYFETLIPLVSAQNNVPAVESLELQLAARRDDYSIDGANSTLTTTASPTPVPATRVTQDLTSTDPTVSLRYKPVKDVTIRGSFGTGFLPPALNQLVPDPPGFFSGAQLGGLTDPRRGNEAVGDITLLRGGNPDLQPEESESWSAGIILTPRFVPGLRASIDWIRIRKEDNVAFFSPDQVNIDNELAIPGFLTRGPASGGFDVGPITAISSQFLNVSSQEVEALDLALDYVLQAGTIGEFTFGANATHNKRNTTQVSSAAPQIDSIGLFGALPWQASVDLQWSLREWTVGWATRYYDSYCLLTDCAEGPLTLSQGARSVPSQTYHDVFVRYRFPQVAPVDLLSNLDIRLGVKNVFDKEPPFDARLNSYYSTYGDPRLASYYVSVAKSFF